MEKKLCFVLATLDDLHDVGMIYKKIHEDLSRTINYPKWPLGIYPIEEDAKEAIEKQELYILKDDQQTVGTVILNHCQDDGYQNAHWLVSASHQEVMVIHTLAIDPQKKGHGYAGDIINSIKK